MYAQLTGRILETQIDKDVARLVLDVRGIGFEILIPKSSAGLLRDGAEKTIYVSESVTAYDGATTLYGFLTKEEKAFFLHIRENVGGMGPKKALEALDKISKSLPDFKKAVSEGDSRVLVSLFGFTKKTAEKIVFALKGKADDWSVSGQVKWAEAAGSSTETEALTGLINLGYRPEEARALLTRARANAGEKAETEALLKEALRLTASQ